jgi:hypothetical protein
MTDFIQRLASLGSMGPEVMLQVLGMILDGIGTGEEWAGENLDKLGELTQELADKVRGIKDAK